MSNENVSKTRKNINISLQSEKYGEIINAILNEWDKEGLNISTTACDNLILANKISKSPTLLNVINLYQLSEKILAQIR